MNDADKIPRKISRAAFEDANLAGATFVDVCLSNAAFTNVNLDSARFDDINFSNAEITANCNFSGMKIDGILVEDLLAAYRHQCSASAS